jgi:altronate dehydratase small subunit
VNATRSDAHALNGWDAIVIHPDDDVAVAVRDLTAGSEVAFRRNGATETMRVIGAIDLGHKFALHPIAADATIRKYGEVIGTATDGIGAGAHVHVHNMKSRRARRES